MLRPNRRSQPPHPRAVAAGAAAGAAAVGAGAAAAELVRAPQQRELVRAEQPPVPPVPQALQAPPPARARPLGRTTRARGSTPGRPHQQISINASSVHHLSRKNERIDQQGGDGQSSSQQIDHFLTFPAARPCLHAGTGVGKSTTHLCLGRLSRGSRGENALVWRRTLSMINRPQSRARRRCSQRTQRQPHGFGGRFGYRARLHAANSSVEIVSPPIADGGDGTSAVLRAAREGTTRETIVPDPLGRPVRASFGLLDDGRTAVLDVATASGLTLLQSHEQDPLFCSSRGTGKLLSTALDAGVESVILGVGGSATVDGGAGLLAALGVGLLTTPGRPFRVGAQGSPACHASTCHARTPALGRVKLRVACDVDSLLLGPHGAARAFGPQKGATPEAVRELEQNLTHFADVIEQTTGREVRHAVSGGAAGGIAAGLFGVLGAT